MNKLPQFYPPPGLLDCANGTLIAEVTRNGRQVQWRKVGQGEPYEGCPKSRLREWDGQGDMRPYFQCSKCFEWLQQDGMCFSVSDIPVCMTCREEYKRSVPNPKKIDDPVLRILNGKMTSKQIFPKAKLPGNLKQTEEHLSMLRDKGLVRYHPVTYQWEKVNR